MNFIINSLFLLTLTKISPDPSLRVFAHFSPFLQSSIFPSHSHRTAMTNAEKSKLPKKKGDTSNTAKARHKSDQDKGKKNKRPKISFVWKDRGPKLIVVHEMASAETGLPGTSKIQATPACLIANGTATPIKICTSGWRPTPGCGLNLNGEKWTLFVRDFCAKIEFPLKLSIRDTPQSGERMTENDGRYDACHAEKKVNIHPS